MLVIPAIDLKDGRCVRLTQGRKSDVKTYDADPVEMARAFASAGAQLLHVVDLDGAFEGIESANRAVVRKIIDSVHVAVEFGGGLRSIADVKQVIDLGVERVIIGTMAAESTEVLKVLVNRYDSLICAGVDARDGVVMTRGWETTTGIQAVDLARSLAALGITRIIYTDIARDGMLTGPNIEQTVGIAQAAGIHVTASGGISCLADIKRLRDANEPLVDSVIIGKAFYEGKFSFEDAFRTAGM
jgi:phosphoribosylformimino-5-aminoimidazole carboxamide ribotide isomerase